MKRALILFAASTIWIGCGSYGNLLGGGGRVGPDECASGTVRCSNNTYQWCTGGGTHTAKWEGIRTCQSPQICRVYTAGPTVGLGGANGCFDPNAYCPSVGYSECASQVGDSALYECVLRASDQTLQWSVTNCNQLVPTSMCTYGDYEGLACYEIVRNCPDGNGHCEGNDFVYCAFAVYDKAVFDWDRYSCSLLGLVCKVDQYGFEGCVSP
jgi:hypothetical protein